MIDRLSQLCPISATIRPRVLVLNRFWIDSSRRSKLIGLVRCSDESRGPCAADVVLHSEPAEGDSTQSLGRAQFLHQFVAGAIGQADIAYDKSNFFVSGLLDGLVCCVSERDQVSTAFEHHFHARAGVEMVVDHEHAAMGFCRIVHPCAGPGSPDRFFSPSVESR